MSHLTRLWRGTGTVWPTQDWNSLAHPSAQRDTWASVVLLAHNWHGMRYDVALMRRALELTTSFTREEWVRHDGGSVRETRQASRRGASRGCLGSAMKGAQANVLRNRSAQHGADADTR